MANQVIDQEVFFVCQLTPAKVKENSRDRARTKGTRKLDKQAGDFQFRGFPSCLYISWTQGPFSQSSVFPVSGFCCSLDCRDGFLPLCKLRFDNGERERESTSKRWGSQEWVRDSAQGVGVA